MRQVEITGPPIFCTGTRSDVDPENYEKKFSTG
jgi:hypothetical protein